MKKQLLNHILPILVSVEAYDQIQKVALFPHSAGFSCEIYGKPTDKIAKAIITFLECYACKEPSLPIPLAFENMTPFTQKVLQFLQTIPFGQTYTYGQIAKAIDSPLGFRAVGGACGRNPFPLFLPCHRVLAKNGLGGFSEGLEIKNALLHFELNETSS